MLMRTAAALALFTLFEAAAPARVPIALRILTYNIHHGEGTDGQFDLARTAALINSAQADLVALQEVDRGTTRSGGVDQLAELERLTGMRGAFGKAMDFQSGSYGVAVLSSQAIVGVRNLALPAAVDREPRVGLTVDVRVDAGTTVQFTGTHLDQGRDQSVRLAQAGFLNDVLSATDTRPAILAGDMNSRPDSEVMEIFGLRWANPFPFPIPASPPAQPRGLVDHVLARPAERWRPVSAQVIDDRLASDHRPLLVVLEWTPAR